MARKMGRNLKRAAAGLMACAAIALCAVSPAWGAERASDVVNVTVPTRIECALGADGTVTAPGGLEVVNNGPQDLYVGASTVDDFGQKVEFAMDLGGSPLLSRAGGKDVEGEVEFAGSSRKGLGLAVSKLNRTSHAALMDAAAQGEAPMFTVGFKFTFKALQGSMSISGGAKLGKTLTAAVSGAQADAKLAYRWYRDGQLIAGAETASYTANEADQGKKLKCEAYDAAGRYVGGVSAEVGPVKGPEAFAVFSADDGSLNFYKRVDVPKAGEQFEGKTVTEVYTGFEDKVFNINNYAKPDWSDATTNTPWFNHRLEIKTIDVVDPKIRPQALAFWFLRCEKLIRVNMSKLDTASTTSASGLFARCDKLTDITLPPDMSHIVYLTDMFYHCISLQSLDLTCIGVGAQPRNLFGVLMDCHSLKSLTIPNQTPSEISRAFSRCYSLKDLSFINDWDMGQIELGGEEFNEVFNGCTSVTSLNLSNWTTRGITKYEKMFHLCSSLSSLEISGLNTTSATNMGEIFGGCNNLKTITLGDGFTWKGADSYPPTPSPSHISGADGYWYDAATSDAYKPEEIPNNKAATYVAVNPAKAPTVTIEGEAFYGSTLTARVSGQPAGTTATSYQWQWSIDGKAWNDSQYASAKTDSITLVDNGIYSPMQNYYRCVVTITAGKKRVPQGISEAVGPVVPDNREAFAVYSEDDNSLNFYKRSEIPKVGEKFEGLTVSQVYTGVESGRCYDEARDVTWYDRLYFANSITVIDSIQPIMTDSWFRSYGGSEIDLTKLDTTNTLSMDDMFLNCSNLKTLKVGDKFQWQNGACGLHAPSGDGKWYAASDGGGYAPSDIPSNKADTYYASKTLLPAATDDAPEAAAPSVDPGMNVVDSDVGSLTDVDTTGHEDVVTETAENEEAERLPDEVIWAESEGDEKRDGSGPEITSAAGSPPEEEGLMALTSDELSR